MRKIVIITNESSTGEDEIYCEMFNCPNCMGQILEDSNYCPDCGSKITWDLKECLLDPPTLKEILFFGTNFLLSQEEVENNKLYYPFETMKLSKAQYNVLHYAYEHQNTIPEEYFKNLPVQDKINFTLRLIRYSCNKQTYQVKLNCKVFPTDDGAILVIKN